jgi:hypothetical protein
MGRRQLHNYDADSGVHGQRMGEIVGVDDPPNLRVKLLQKSVFAVTRLSCERHDYEVTASVPREDAYVAALEFRDVPSHPFWAEGRETRSEPKRRGQCTLIDLNLDVGANLRFPFDSLHMYVPRSALDAVTSGSLGRAALHLECTQSRISHVLGELEGVSPPAAATGGCARKRADAFRRWHHRGASARSSSRSTIAVALDSVNPPPDHEVRRIRRVEYLTVSLRPDTPVAFMRRPTSA